jgi:hypothetical protein
MRIASTLLPLAYLAFLPSIPHGSGPSGAWAESELVWPRDNAGKLWQTYSIIAEKEPSVISWPVTIGDICSGLKNTVAGNAQGNGPLLSELRSFCEEKKKPRPFSLTLDAGAYPIERRYPLGQPFESFNPGWGSARVDPEVAEAWTGMPSVAKVELGYPFSPDCFVHFRIGLRRDLVAWHRDALGHNHPLSEKEVDLNEPSLGYFHAENDHFAFTLGRFKVHWSPSPDFGLALSQSVPFHNAAEFALKMPRARYRFLVSSLNPWLEGTPLGDSSSENYPVGSEEYRQRRYPRGNGSNIFHNRVWDADVKTLFAHRLEGDLGPLSLGITETQVIGGKVPDLRDAGPFVFFHNDFKDGYTNSALSLDAALALPLGLSLAGELYLDDAQYAETEGEGETASLLGYLAEVRHGFPAAGWHFLQSLHAIRTDPFVYGYLQPLNTMASRHVLATNMQESGDPVFVDRYVVDYPMGYLRGGDAFDFWYRMDAWRGPIRLTLGAALLSRGEVGLHTPYEEYYSASHESPTGTAEKEVRLRLEASWRSTHGLEVHGGLGWQGFRNLGHEPGRYADYGQIALGTSWTLSP